jgi:hypothetical protein
MHWAAPAAPPAAAQTKPSLGIRGLVAVQFVFSAFARSGTHAAGAVQRSILREALAVALGARGHQAPAIALTADQRAAVIASYPPEARLLDHRFPGGGRALTLPGRSGASTADTAVTLRRACVTRWPPRRPRRSARRAHRKREWYDEEFRAAHVRDLHRDHQRWSGGRRRQRASLARGRWRCRVGQGSFRWLRRLRRDYGQARKNEASRSP